MLGQVVLWHRLSDDSWGGAPVVCGGGVCWKVEASGTADAELFGPITTSTSRRSTHYSVVSSTETNHPQFLLGWVSFPWVSQGRFCPQETSSDPSCGQIHACCGITLPVTGGRQRLSLSWKACNFEGVFFTLWCFFFSLGLSWCSDFLCFFEMDSLSLELVATLCQGRAMPLTWGYNGEAGEVVRLPVPHFQQIKTIVFPQNTIFLLDSPGFVLALFR